jgi:hypothetical protein
VASDDRLTDLEIIGWRRCRCEAGRLEPFRPYFWSMLEARRSVLEMSLRAYSAGRPADFYYEFREDFRGGR